MSYRDDLGQAHQRIAQLEGELREAKGQAPKRSGTRTALVFAGLALVAAAAVALVGVSSRLASPRLVLPVDELVAHPEAHVGQKLRVQGDLVVGTIASGGEPCQLRFVLEREHLHLPVRLNNCIAPDPFRDVPNMLVLVDGQLQPDGSFEGTDMFVRREISFPKPTTTER